MLTATLLALAAAVLHAAWNLWVKQSGDRFIALWGQMTLAGVGGLIVTLAVGWPRDLVWWPLVASGIVHLYYVVALARAYDIGDFSVTYPIARGSGALLAAVGGLALLGDEVSLLASLGIAVAVTGIWLLAGRADSTHVRAGLVVAVTIGLYSVIDAHGSRETGGNLYPLLLFTSASVFITAHGLMAGRGADMATAMRTMWPRFALAGTASALTYWMVLVAVQDAPVGYVTALRESSVVVVALVGTRFLGEPHARRRIVASLVVVAGLAVLIAGR